MYGEGDAVGLRPTLRRVMTTCGPDPCPGQLQGEVTELSDSGIVGVRDTDLECSTVSPSVFFTWKVTLAVQSFGDCGSTRGGWPLPCDRCEEYERL